MGAAGGQQPRARRGAGPRRPQNRGAPLGQPATGTGSAFRKETSLRGDGEGPTARWADILDPDVQAARAAGGLAGRQISPGADSARAHSSRHVASTCFEGLPVPALVEKAQARTAPPPRSGTAPGLGPERMGVVNWAETACRTRARTVRGKTRAALSRGIKLVVRTLIDPRPRNRFVPRPRLRSRGGRFRSAAGRDVPARPSHGKDRQPDWPATDRGTSPDGLHGPPAGPSRTPTSTHRRDLRPRIRATARATGRRTPRTRFGHGRPHRSIPPGQGQRRRSGRPTAQTSPGESRSGPPRTSRTPFPPRPRARLENPLRAGTPKVASFNRRSPPPSGHAGTQ